MVQHHAVSPVQPKSQSDNNIAHMTRSKSKANNESIEIPRYNTEQSDALSPGHTLHILNLFATPYVMEPDIANMHDDSHSPGSLCVPESCQFQRHVYMAVLQKNLTWTVLLYGMRT